MNGFDQVWLKYEDQGLLDGLEWLDDVNRISRSLRANSLSAPRAG